MKFSLLQKYRSAPEKPPNIIRPNYDDPAFSPDPLANPFFVSNLPPPWSSPPGPGHPTLKKPPRLVDGEEYCPPPPPNTPAVPEDEISPNQSHSAIDYSTASSNPTRPTNSSADLPPSTDSVSATPTLLLFARPPSSSSFASTSTDLSSSTPPHVPPKVEMPHHAHHHSSLQRQKHDPPQKTESKKRQGFLSRLLGPPSVTESSESSSSSSSPRNRPRNERAMSVQHPPRSNYNMIPQHGPISAPAPATVPRHRAPRSAPEMHRSDRPPMPQRAKTVGVTEPDLNSGSGRVVIPVVAVAAAAGRAADERRLRQDLDRIDELDETNPFGSALHHGGPYEAISRIIQTPAAKRETGWSPQSQTTSGRSLVLPGDVYRNAQLIALQTGSLNLKPGQVLTRDFAMYSEPVYASTPIHPHSHPQPQLNSHHDRRSYHEPSSLELEQEPRTSPAYPNPTQMAPSVLQAGSFGDNPVMASTASSINSPPTRRRTPSPTAATTHSSEDDDAGLAIGMALMDAAQESSFASSDSATVVGPSIIHSSPVPIKIVLREPTETDESSPPPYAVEPPCASTSQVPISAINGVPLQGPATFENNHRREEVVAPPIAVPQGLPMERSTPHFVPIPIPAPAPIPPSPPSRHASYQSLHQQGPPPQIYSRPSRQDIYSMQPPPPQNAIPINAGLSRSSTYAPTGSFGPRPDRLGLASSLKANDGSPSPSSAPSLRGRESDVRSMQQSIVTISNASSRSQGENPRRNRYLPKRLVMPAPLQPVMQNLAMTHQVRFDPQANTVVYHRDSLPSKQIKRASLPPQPSRAQDIPMSQSNSKLRKRTSLTGSMTSASQLPPPPVAAVSLSANIVTADKHARGAEKVHRKVLSKRK